MLAGSRAGEYRGLFSADSPRQIVSELPEDSEQRNGDSFGRVADQIPIVSQFTRPDVRACRAPRRDEGRLDNAGESIELLRPASPGANGLGGSRVSPTTDLNADGATNLDEYLAGTNPRNHESCFDLQPWLTPGGEFRLRFMALPWKSYSVCELAATLTASSTIRSRSQ